jgi:hypothetical protein
VRCAIRENAYASPAARRRLIPVPSHAASDLAPSPYERGIITSITANAPTTATARDDRPCRIAATMNCTTMTRLAMSPTSARKPCIRPRREQEHHEGDRKPEDGLAPVEVGEGVGILAFGSGWSLALVHPDTVALGDVEGADLCHRREQDGAALVRTVLDLDADNGAGLGRRDLARSRLDALGHATPPTVRIGPKAVCVFSSPRGHRRASPKIVAKTISTVSRPTPSTIHDPLTGSRRRGAPQKVLLTCRSCQWPWTASVARSGEPFIMVAR